MGDIIITFYCLPYHDLLILFALLTYGFLRLDRHFGGKLWWKRLICTAAVLWIGIILLFTVTTREAGSTDTVLLTPFHSYREMEATGNIEILRSNFMNVILFYPGGLLAVSALPEKWPRWLRAGLVFLFFAGCSLGIEYFQYATASGRAEIDDVIHNALGALVGCILGVIPVYQKERG